MIKYSSERSRPCGWLLVAALLGLTGCGEKPASDYCRNHYEFHAGHAEGLAELHITLAEDGKLLGTAALPTEAFRGTEIEAVTATLLTQDGLFRLPAEAACRTDEAKAEPNTAGVNFMIALDCGPDNNPGQIDIALFDSLPAVDEVLVTVVTPATSKHFAISRQCDAPIFRLK